MRMSQRKVPKNLTRIGQNHDLTGVMIPTCIFMLNGNIEAAQVSAALDCGIYKICLSGINTFD